MCSLSYPTEVNEAPVRLTISAVGPSRVVSTSSSRKSELAEVGKSAYVRIVRTTQPDCVKITKPDSESLICDPKALLATFVQRRRVRRR